jgi:hypothetical protein
VLFVSVGELVGFCVPGVLGAWTWAMSPVVQLPVVVAAGMVEGAALGLAQALVLRRALPGFRSVAWVVATSSAAGIAWLIGMVPSATHAVWSTWPDAGVAAAAVLLGVVLLLSIGTAQALVLPAGVPRRATWMWWTALGWCAGLLAFSLVAPPLWHEGQSTAAIVLIGLAGGAVMATVMAAVTGVGMVRICARAVEPGPGHPLKGSRTLSAVVGTAVRSPDGRVAGQVRDLVVDLAGGLDRVPVTGVVIGGHGQVDRVVAWDRLRAGGRHWSLLSPEVAPAAHAPHRSTELLVRRDILDSPVVLADPPGRARVGDVVLDLDEHHAWVTGLDLSSASVVRRLLRRPVAAERVAQVPVSNVHFVSSPAHSAQLAVPDAMIFGLQPRGMAEVLTRVPVAHGRDILGVADERVVDRTLPLLHPDVRSRLVHAGPAPRRTRRLAGWVLHRPGEATVPQADSGPDDPTSSEPLADR